MSAVSDYANSVNGIFTRIGGDVDKLVASFDGIKNEIAALKATIDKLQNSPGTLTPDDQKLLDDSQAQAAALVDRLDKATDAIAALDDATAPDALPTPPAADGSSTLAAKKS